MHWKRSVATFDKVSRQQWKKKKFRIYSTKKAMHFWKTPSLMTNIDQKCLH